MYSFNLDNQMLTRADDKQFAQNSVNAPELIFNFGEGWQDGTSVARFTTNDGSNNYDVIIVPSNEGYGTVKCPAEVMSGNAFYLSCKNSISNQVITTNRIEIKLHENKFNEGGLTPEQASSLEDQILAKIDEIEDIKTGLKKTLDVFKQALYSDDADFSKITDFQNYINNL